MQKPDGDKLCLLSLAKVALVIQAYRRAIRPAFPHDLGPT